MNVEKFLSSFKTSVDFACDFSNWLECNKKIANYDRSSARSFLSNMVNEYENEINFFGKFFDGTKTISCECFSDFEIRVQLQYLALHIPVYSLMKKGEEEFAKKVLEWIMGM